eukprot:4856714-Pyramimonas_sp.AAC.1
MALRFHAFQSSHTMVQFHEDPTFALLKNYLDEDYSHALRYIYAKWGSPEIFESDWRPILKSLVPTEVGQSRHASVHGSGERSFGLM